MAEPGIDTEALRETATDFQRLLRRLAEIAMSVTHHDANESDPGYVHEVVDMERRFRPVINAYTRTRAAAEIARLRTPAPVWRPSREDVARALQGPVGLVVREAVNIALNAPEGGTGWQSVRIEPLVDAVLALLPASPWRPINEAKPNVAYLLGWWDEWPTPIWRTDVNFARDTRGGWWHGAATHFTPIPAPPPATSTEALA